MLPEHERELFAGRDRVDYIVLVDGVPGSDTLGRIKHMMNFEFTKAPKSTPLTLEGGFQLFFESYPGECEASPETEGEHLFEEEVEDTVGYDADLYDGLLAPTPVPKPKDLTGSGLLIDIEDFSTTSRKSQLNTLPAKAETLQVFCAFDATLDLFD